MGKIKSAQDFKKINIVALKVFKTKIEWNWWRKLNYYYSKSY